MPNCTYARLQENLWNIHHPASDAYLIVGNERAALIDALLDDCGLIDAVRAITDKPVDVLITHGHLDHAGSEVINLHNAGFDIYMNHKDIAVLSHGRSEGVPSADMFKNLENGQVFDFGGFSLEAISLPGHTQGSMVFLDRANARLFSGDAIGSGAFLMSTDFSTTLTDCVSNIRQLRSAVSGLANLAVYVGHVGQSDEAISLSYIDTMIELIEKVISGELVGERKNPLMWENTSGIEFPVLENERFALYEGILLIYDITRL